MKTVRKIIIFLAFLASFSLLTAMKSQAAPVVVLDPGHGGPTTQGLGAVYPPYMEKDLNLDLAGRLKSQLEAAGVTVYLTRTKDVTMDLSKRAEYAKSVGASYLISLHFNSDNEHDERGAEVWISAYGDDNKKEVTLASHVLRQLKGLGLYSRGVRIKLGKKGDYYGIIRNGEALGIPTVIIEHCHLDCPEDVAVLDKKGIEAFAEADAAGIISFLRSRGELPADRSGKDGKYPNLFINEASYIAYGRTRYGFPVDDDGNVGYTDPEGEVKNFTQEEWRKLLSVWAHNKDPEYHVKQQSVSNLDSLLS